MSDAAYNLIDEPWLPVRRRSGAVERIPPWRVNDGLTDDPFVRFAWPRPDFDGASHEFLIGLLSTAAAPADEDEWEHQWLAPPEPEALRQRFLRVADAFRLDGPGPRFLQDMDPLDGAEPKNAANLLIDAPGAQTLRNNTDIFVKRSGTMVLGRAAGAMALFTLQCYAPSGGAGHRTSLRGGGPLTTLVVSGRGQSADTLWGRLWPNVETREQVAARSGLDPTPQRSGSAAFPWLGPTRTSDPKADGGKTTPENVDPLQVYWGMPRRIRLVFEPAHGRPCSLTEVDDSMVVSGYATKNYGISYSEGFEHPLTPYYRENSNSATKRPVHPGPGGITYQRWPGLVVRGERGLREPAQVVRQWHSGRGRGGDEARLAAFGYDMDNMKARAWVEAEMPLWRFDDFNAATRDRLEDFVRAVAAGAGTAAGQVTRAIKSARHRRPRDVRGDFGFVAERFFRDTERSFFEAIDRALDAIRADPDGDDPTRTARLRWAPVMETAALRLFDEHVPLDGIEDLDMQRCVKARYFLKLALGGRGKVGRALFEDDLKIPSPNTTRARRQAREAK